MGRAWCQGIWEIKDLILHQAVRCIGSRQVRDASTKEGQALGSFPVAKNGEDAPHLVCCRRQKKTYDTKEHSDG